MPENWSQDVNSTDRAKVSDRERAHMIAALVREREQYVRRGLGERVKLVDAELARYGHEAAAPEKRAERRPGRPPRTETRMAEESVGE